MANATKRPNIPGLKDLDEPVRKVMIPVKELLDIHEGRIGAPGDRFVRLSELSSLDIVGRSTVRPSDGSAPDPPTNVQAVGGAFANRISWTNATNDDLWGVEVFCAVGTNDWTLSSLVGTVTIPQEQRGQSSQFIHNMADILGNHYYWVRSVDYAGNASRLAPPGEEDGLLVPGEDTVGQTIDEVLAALTAPNAPAWMPGISSYEAGDIVEYDTRLYQCYNAPVPAGVIPSSTEGGDYWRRTGILRQGDVDGKPTVGVNGELVVENTIYARALKVDEIQSQLIDTQLLQVRYSILVGAKPPVDADNTQDELDLGAAIENAKANGHTLIQGGYINTDIIMVDRAQIKYAAIDTLRVDDHAVSTMSSAHTSGDITAGSGWSTIQSLFISLDYAGDAVFFASCMIGDIRDSGGAPPACYHAGCALRITVDGYAVAYTSRPADTSNYFYCLITTLRERETMFGMQSLSAGPHTVNLQVYTAGDSKAIGDSWLTCLYLLR